MNIIKEKEKIITEINKSEEKNKDLFYNLLELNNTDFNQINNISDLKLLKEILIYNIYHNCNNLLKTENNQFNFRIYENLTNTGPNYKNEFFFKTKCEFNDKLFDILNFSFLDSYTENPLTLCFYSLMINKTAREKNIISIERKLKELNSNNSFSYYLNSELIDLKERKDSLPIDIITRIAYQDYFKNRLFKIFGINKEELNEPVNEDSNEENFEVIKEYSDNEMFEYQTNRGKTLIKKYPSNNPVIIIKNNIEFY